MSADALQDLREAIVASVREDGQIRTICGRVSRLIGLIADWNALPMPVLTYFVVDGPPMGGNGRPLRVSLQLTAWAEGHDSLAICGRLLVAAQAAISVPALAGQGIDVTRIRATRREAPVDPQGLRQLARQDVDLEFEVRIP